MSTLSSKLMDLSKIAGPATQFAQEGDGVSIYLNTAAIPVYAATASALILALQVLLLSAPLRNIRAWISCSEDSSEDASSCIRDPAETPDQAGFLAEHYWQKGFVSHALQISKLIGCLAWLLCSMTIWIIGQQDRDDGNQIRSQADFRSDTLFWATSYYLLSQGSLQFALCLVAAYSCFLALVSVLAAKRCRRIASHHLSALLFVTFVVSAYRDIYPLGTYAYVPLDQDEGKLLWIKTGILSLVGVIIPLISPREYIPVDPVNPSPEPHPEQTASWLSLVTYTWANPIIATAMKATHLSRGKLTPLADYDYAANLVKRSFQFLDPFVVGGKRHIFWGIIKVFRADLMVMSAAIIVYALAMLASPIGVERLLNFIENHGEGAVYHPWVWILCLLFGPIVSSAGFQWYLYFGNKCSIRTEAILTQLVFEHALRIRMKAEVSEEQKHAQQSALPAVSETASTAGSSTIVDDALMDASETAPDTPQSNDTNIQPDKIKQKPSMTKSNKALGHDAVLSQQKKSTSSNLVGRINNLVTTDLKAITGATDFLMGLLYVPTQLILGIWFLYSILGWSALFGFAVMLALFPIPGYMAKKIQNVQKEKMKRTDARVQTVTEVMSVLRMVKLFGWESRMAEKLEEKRDEELLWTRRRLVIEVANSLLNFMIPIATMIATFAAYTLVMKEELTASRVFSSLSVFDILERLLRTSVQTVSKSIQGKVSLDRIDDFLKNTELLDLYNADVETDTTDRSTDLNAHEMQDTIGFRDAIFTWSEEETLNTPAPARRRFKLQIEGELIFKMGSVNIIIGPTGSGKTSMLMALLGEMHFVPSNLSSWFKLPRGRGVAYAAQESWVQNETIRENILFGAPYDDARYKATIQQCALEPDLSLLKAGDATEVGEKGLTLSGGQKARITLARAIYSSAEILLLDDIFAALDVHTSKWIVQKCFSGNLVKGRTVLLVTHNVSIISPIAQFMVVMGSNGQIVSSGSVSETIAGVPGLAEEVAEDKEVADRAETVLVIDSQDETTLPNNGKLVVEEEIAEGHVGWPAFKLFLAALGGSYPLSFWLLFLGGIFLGQLCDTFQIWFLGFWAAQYEEQDASTVNGQLYLTVYSCLLLLSVLCTSVSFVTLIYGSVMASRTIHQKLVGSILSTTLRWLDTTPTARIIARCTQDIATVDGPIPQNMATLVELSFTMLLRLGAVVLFTPVFLIPGIAVGLLGGWLCEMYMKAQLTVKRETSNAKAPVLSHFGAAISGLVSIRAYGAQRAVKTHLFSRIDQYVRSARMFFDLNRWINFRIHVIGSFFSASLAAYLVYGVGVFQASDVGFSLNMAVGFSTVILWWIRNLNDSEINGNSLERIRDYIAIEQESKDSEARAPPAFWPASGDLRVENLSARYSEDGPNILHDISFHVKSGERVGVVGRTGSGKSSLTLALLRCIFTDGDVYYDGISTRSINLGDLRSKVTIIPQIPELLSGTLRHNLDPFEQYDDMTLNDALRSAGLFSLQEETDENRLTLDSVISSGGGNLSVGQRQILALARAMLRRSKLLIFDEATSAIDYKTDAIIQSSLRHELQDVTQIIIAHRLQTILDADKIMVLDAGNLVEFGTPRELLMRSSGMLRTLVDQSGDREALYAMAGASETWASASDQ